MIGAKWSGVFPLRVDDSVSFANRDPSVFANRNTRALIRILEPRNDAGRFRSVAVCRFVVVRQRAIKRILPGREFYRDEIASISPTRIVETAVTFGPFFVP